jgi:hypothetical protein
LVKDYLSKPLIKKYIKTIFNWPQQGQFFFILDFFPNLQLRYWL